MYGFDIRDNEDPHLVAPEKAIAAANAVVTEGFFLGIFIRFSGYLQNVDDCVVSGRVSHMYVPISTHLSQLLQFDLPAVRHLPSWFPGARFKRQAAEWRKDVLGLVHDPWRTVQQDLVRLLALFYVCVTLKWLA